MKKQFALGILASYCVAFFNPAYAQATAAPASPAGLAGLFSSSKENELIEPEQAFKLKVAVKSANTLAAELIPAKGYYLYKDKVRFTIKNPAGITIKAVTLPPGDIKTDQIFGRTEVYRTPVRVEIALNRTTKTNAVTLAASYQGCHEKAGVCYPPIDKTVNLVLPPQ
jgi:thiol:disulfide interchange protein